MFVCGRWVHWGAPLGWSDTSAVAGIVWLRCGGRRVHPESLGSLGYALGFLRFIQGGWVHQVEPWWSSDTSGAAEFIRVRPGTRRVHPEPLRSFKCALVVVGFIRGHWGAQWASSGSSCVAGYIGVRIEARPLFLDSLGGRWVRAVVHWIAPLRS